MKVLIPCTDDTGEQVGLYIPYGQAPFFALWDSATECLEFQANPLAGQPHACACSTTHWMQRAGVDALITGDMGRRAAQRLTEAGIQVFHAPEGALGELLASYRHGGIAPAPTGEPRWLCHGERADRHGHRHADRHRGGKGDCGGAHGGRRSQGHHERSGHGGGCCHSAQIPPESH